MEELHRIAKQDAIFTCRVPYGSSDDAYEDPTHVRQFFYIPLLIFLNLPIGVQTMGIEGIGTLKKSNYSFRWNAIEITQWT